MKIKRCSQTLRTVPKKLSVRVHVIMLRVAFIGMPLLPAIFDCFGID